MKEIYLTIAGRIRQDLQDLERVVERTNCIWRKARTSADDYYVDAAALNLHGFYAGMEHLFEAIADGIDRVKPSSANWHQELLHQMSVEILSVRPPVLSVEVRDRLDRYRGFRYVVRNVYTFNLDTDQAGTLVRALQPTMERVSQELLAFSDFLERLAAGS